LSPDGRWLAGGYSDGMVRVWDAHRRTLRRTFQCDARSRITDLTWSADSKKVAFSINTVIATLKSWCVWEPESDVLVKQLRAQLVSLSPQGTILASPATSGTVELREIDSDRVLHSLATGVVRRIVFSPDGKILAILT